MRTVKRTARIPTDGTLVNDVESGMPLRARRVTFEEFIRLECEPMAFVETKQMLKSGCSLDIKRDCPYYVMHRDRARPVRVNKLKELAPWHWSVNRPKELAPWHWSVNRPKELALYVQTIAERLKAQAKKLGTPSGKTVSALIVVIASAMRIDSDSIFCNKLSNCIPRSRFVQAHEKLFLSPSISSLPVHFSLYPSAIYCRICT